MNVTESENTDWNTVLPFPLFSHSFFLKLEFRSFGSVSSWKPPPLHGPHVKVLNISDGVTQPGRRAVSLWARVHSQQCFGWAVDFGLHVPPARTHLRSILCGWESAVGFQQCRAWGLTAAESLQSRPTLCDPIDVSPPGSAVPGILQARTLEWVAISFSNAWKWKVKVKLLSRVRLLVTPRTAAHQPALSMGFSR